MESNDRSKFQYEGLKWLHELEVINHPQVINNLKLNILMVSKSIKEVEFLIYREKKSMLVLLELSWFGRKFGRKNIISEVEQVLSQMLPTFRFRITENPAIMNMAVETVKHALRGGKNEVPTHSSVDPVQRESTQLDDASSGPSTEHSTSESSIDSHTEE